jgi:precorrin-3B C17-methyltransferase
LKTLYVVGIGPGDTDEMTVRAKKVLEESHLIIGYGVYVDLLRESFPGKEFRTTPMTRERERCQMALEAADRGEQVAMACGGDAGVYGMASLLLEMGTSFPEVEVCVVPGVTAALSGGALLGAPLSHDFAVISLSDRLTPKELIRKRLILAAQADFAIVIYNPASKGRPDYLKKACQDLLTVKSPDTVCGMCRQIGRDGEEWEILSLGQLKDAPADMFTTVFIGSSRTKEVNGRMVTPRGYLDRKA